MKGLSGNILPDRMVWVRPLSAGIIIILIIVIMIILMMIIVMIMMIIMISMY